MIKNFILCISFLLVVGCAASIPNSESLNKMSPQELNQLSIDLWKNGKYSNPELALKYANLASSKDPNYGRAYYTKGFAYYNLGKHELAIENFSKAIEIDPNIAESYNSRGWVYGTLSDYVNAIKDFTKAIELDPKYKLAYNNRAMAYLEINENEKACSDFQKVCELGDCGNLTHARRIGKCK